ncbi:MAG TPA: rhodanese-like domain-containing protein [Thermoleophilaceae bacterium]|nr:rhodanese-like domain-containing protein [Thermoleophilaceae bacterium]
MTVPEEQEIEPTRVAELAASGEAELVDVRTPGEHEAGRIAGARHIPFDELTARSEEIDRSRPVVLFCRGGGRSGAAGQAFAASGWRAHSMAGGLEHWVEQGLPIEPEGGHVAGPSGLPE